MQDLRRLHVETLRRWLHQENQQTSQSNLLRQELPKEADQTQNDGDHDGRSVEVHLERVDQEVHLRDHQQKYPKGVLQDLPTPKRPHQEGQNAQETQIRFKPLDGLVLRETRGRKEGKDPAKRRTQEQTPILMI